MARRPGHSAPARGKGSVALVNIHEPGPREGRLDQWPVLAASGALEVRLAETEAEIEAAQRLRYHIFYEEMSAIPSPAMRESRRDFDKFDAFCDHILVVDRANDRRRRPTCRRRHISDDPRRRCGASRRFLHGGRIRYRTDAERHGARLARARTGPLLRAQKLSRETDHDAVVVARAHVVRGPLLDSMCCSVARRCRASIPTRWHCRFRTCITSTALSTAPACGRGPSFMSR